MNKRTSNVYFIYTYVALDHFQDGNDSFESSESVSQSNWMNRLNRIDWIESSRMNESINQWMNRPSPTDWKRIRNGIEWIEDGHGILYRVIDQTFLFPKTKITRTIMFTMCMFQGLICRRWGWRLNESIKAPGGDKMKSKVTNNEYSRWPLQPSFGQCSSILMNCISIPVYSFETYRLPTIFLSVRIEWSDFCLNSIAMKSQMTGQFATSLQQLWKTRGTKSNELELSYYE